MRMHHAQALASLIIGVICVAEFSRKGHLFGDYDNYVLLVMTFMYGLDRLADFIP